jgi:DoxX-like family
LNIVLWILQVVLAVLFLLHGYLYVVWPPAMVAQIRQRSPNPQQEVSGISPRFRCFIGVAEWLAAVGLIAPGLSGILLWLIPSQHSD